MLTQAQMNHLRNLIAYIRARKNANQSYSLSELDLELLETILKQHSGQ